MKYNLCFLKVFFFYFVFCVMGCDMGSKKVGEGQKIYFEIGQSAFLVPSKLLSYKEDLSGGVQETVTLDFDPFGILGLENYIQERDGEKAYSFRALISNKGADPNLRMQRILNVIEYDVEEVLKGELRIHYRTNSDTDYYLYGSDDPELYVRCIKPRPGGEYGACTAFGKEIYPGVYISYYFSEYFLSNITLLHQNVLNRISKF